MLVTRSVAADEVGDWIATQPEPFQQVLRAGQQEPVFASFRDRCPADVFGRLAPYSEGKKDCAERPGWCLALCRAGQGRACFGIARTIEVELEDTGEGTLKFPFFMASCAAGHANGCTNAGATVKNGSWIEGTRPAAAATRDCQFRTYTAACAAGAPWGCFMEGMEWAFEAAEGERDIAKARAAWTRACALAPNGSACNSASRRLKNVKD